MAFTSLDKPLALVTKEKHWTHYRQYVEICSIWKNIVTHNILLNTNILSINKDIVYIATSSTGWSQELSFQKCSLLKKINQQLLYTSITKLHFSSAKWSRKNQLNISLHEREKISFFSCREMQSTASNIYKKESQTPQSAFEKWTMNVQNQLTSFSVCPQCQRPASLHELKRWSKCYLCIR